jgi:DNA-binding response OmpR family regulator
VAPPPPARRKLHVLLIEDNADARELMKFGLELAGHRVDVAEDGAAGIELAIAERPHVAIVDLGLPGLDGLSVGRTLREKLGPDLRIVALTGYGQSQDRRRTREAGFDAHITKPATVDDVLAALPD